MPIDGVPTAEELIPIGLARRDSLNRILVSHEGHELLGQKLREAAERNSTLTGDDLRKIIARTKTERKKK